MLNNLLYKIKLFFKKEQYTEKEKELMRKIGYFLIEKHKGEINVAIRELYSYGITDVRFKRGMCIIILTRPGVLIGAKGCNITALSEYLDAKIRIKENRINDYLTIVNPNDYLFDIEDEN